MPLGSASRARDRLEARFGAPGDFRPAPDGAIPAERLRAFLDVGARLAGSCEESEDLQAKMRRVERLDEGELPSGREVAGSTRGLAFVTAEIAPFIGTFFDRRNQALLEAEMGLGEYAYIFALAYRDRIAGEPTRGELFFEGGLSPDVLGALRSCLSNQLDGATGDDAPAGRHRSLEREIRLMREDPQRLPWADRLPDAVQESLAPFRDRLDDIYCASIAGIAMDPDSGRALIIALY